VGKGRKGKEGEGGGRKGGEREELVRLGEGCFLALRGGRWTLLAITTTTTSR